MGLAAAGNSLFSPIQVPHVSLTEDALLGERPGRVGHSSFLGRGPCGADGESVLALAWDEVAG